LGKAYTYLRMASLGDVVFHVSASGNPLVCAPNPTPELATEPNSSSEAGLLENILDAGVFDAVLAHFDHRTIVTLLRVCRGWLLLIDPCETLWRSACRFLWATKVYVAQHIRALILDGNDPLTRLDLQPLSSADLKKRLRASGVSTYQLAPFLTAPRAHLLELVMQKEAPRYPGEPLAKRALRLSLEDSTRGSLTDEEIVSFEWHVRVREAGPFRQLVPLDPWWYNAGVGGRANFSVEQHTTREVKFIWPPGRDPFEIFNVRREARCLWDLDYGGRIVQLSLGQWGPRQSVARHPVTWGFVLVDSATVWTSWPMPPRGEDFLLEDDCVNQLVQLSTVDLLTDGDSDQDDLIDEIA